MKHTIKRIISLLLVVTLLSFSYTEVFAAEGNGDVLVLKPTIFPYHSESSIMPLTHFLDASISVTYEDAGMDIFILTVVDGDAAYVGVKDIVVWHKGWFGIWNEVATSSGGRLDNDSGLGCSITYPGAKVGDTYKITCVHYAEVDGEYKELPNDTGEFKYWDE